MAPGKRYSGFLTGTWGGHYLRQCVRTISAHLARRGSRAGAGVIYTISNSIGGGLHRGAFATIGCTLGIVPHILAAMLGLFSMIRDVGTLSASALDQAQSPSNGAMGLVVRRGFLINVLNPKLTVFFLAFLPQFLDAPPSLLDARLVALGGVFMLITLAVFAGYAYASSIVRERVLGAPVVRRWFQRTLGALLIGLATRLAILDH